MRREYTIGSQIGYHAGVIASENDVLLISELDPSVVEKMGMIPVTGISKAFNFVKKKHGSFPPAYFMPHGGSTMPSLSDLSLLYRLLIA